MINPYLAAMFLSVTVASFSQILLKKSAMKSALKNCIIIRVPEISGAE